MGVLVSGEDLAGLLIGGFILVVGWWQMPKRWRGDYARSDLNAGKLFLPGIESRRGLRRSAPLAIVGFSLGYLCAAAVTLIEGAFNPLLQVIWISLLLVTLLALILMIPVFLFNWPKFAVPPLYRADLGIVLARRKRRRQQRGRPGSSGEN